MKNLFVVSISTALCLVLWFSPAAKADDSGPDRARSGGSEGASGIEKRRAHAETGAATSMDSAPASATARIVVASESGSVGPTYAALVRPDGPWRQPSAEGVTKSGSLDLVVSPGDYVLIASAPGYQLYIDKVTVAEGGPGLFEVELTPAVRISGSIGDEQGAPIAGARVMTNRAAVARPFGMFSDLGWDYIGNQETTGVDASGLWSLEVSGDGKTPLLVEARGFAPAWLSTPDVTAAGSKTTLRQGGQLKVLLDRADDAVVVVAVPRDESAAGSIPPELQRWVWSRQALTRELRWDSLPAGEYRLVAAYPDPTRFGSDIELARDVQVAAGATASVETKLPPTPPPAEAIVRFFAPLSADPAGLRAFVKDGLRAVREARLALEPVVRGRSIYVEGAMPSGDVYLTTPSYLILPAATAAVTPGSSTLVSFPSATVRARLMTKQSRDLPPAAEVRFRSCVKEMQSAVRVALGKRGEVTIPWPSMCQAAVLEVDGFASVALTASVSQGQERSLGEIELANPASVHVRVVYEPSGRPAAHAIVRVSVLRGPATNVVLVEKSSDDNGLLELPSLPSGEEIMFEARDAVTNLAGIERRWLEPGELTTLDPLGIPEPASLTITPSIDGGFLLLYPDTTIQGISLRPLDGRDHGEPRSMDLMPGSNETTFTSLYPSEWTPFVLVRVNDSVHVFELDPQKLESGDMRRIAPQIKPFVFDGLLTAGGRPVAAQLMIKNTSGDAKFGRSLRTRDDGTFQIVLPSRGIYEVEVMRQVDGQMRGTPLGEHSFDDPAQLVRLEMPTGRIEVQVTRRSDRSPIERAQVTAAGRRNRSIGGVQQLRVSSRSNSTGFAILEEVLEGVWTIQARDQAGNAAEATARVSRDATTKVTLSLDAEATAEGRLLELSGSPAAGASLQCLAMGADSLPRDFATETDVVGIFRIPIPRPEPRILFCGATTREGSVVPFILSPGGSTQDLVVPTASGRLLIEGWSAGDLATYWLLGSDSRLFNLSWARSRRSGTALDILRLPSDSWRIVRANSVQAWIQLARGLGGTLPEVANFTLSPGQALSIRLDSANKESTGPNQ
ncbi:MAG: hypothetical protein ACSLFQ_11710 [Thermoanaerobaculia bacterium]